MGLSLLLLVSSLLRYFSFKTIFLTRFLLYLFFLEKVWSFTLTKLTKDHRMQDNTVAPKGTYISTLNPVEPSRWDAYRPANFKANISLSSRHTVGTTGTAFTNAFPSSLTFNGRNATSKVLHPRKVGKTPCSLTIEEMSEMSTVREELTEFCVPFEQVLTGSGGGWLNASSENVER